MRENVKVNVIVEVEVKEEEFKETKKGERKKQGRKPPLLLWFLRQCLEEDPGAEAEQRVVFVLVIVVEAGVFIGERELDGRRVPVVEADSPVLGV